MDAVEEIPKTFHTRFSNIPGRTRTCDLRFRKLILWGGMDAWSRGFWDLGYF